MSVEAPNSNDLGSLEGTIDGDIEVIENEIESQMVNEEQKELKLESERESIAEFEAKKLIVEENAISIHESLPMLNKVPTNIENAVKG